MRQWVPRVRFALRYLFATDLAVMGQVLGIGTRAITSHLVKAAGYHHTTAQRGAVTLIDGARPCAAPRGPPAVVLSAILPICHGPTGRPGADTES